MTGNNGATIKTTATISLLAGIWLFVSPWVYKVQAMPNSWNSWILGILIVVLAAIQLFDPISTRGASVVNLLLGVWVFASPWIFRYSHMTDRLVNSLCVGAVVFIVSAVASSMGHTSAMPPPLRS